jgi:ESAT-6 protein secretion system EspG family protein
MDLRTDTGEYLHPVEVDLLCTLAEVTAPFPLQIPSTGLSEIDRQVMFSGAREQLTDRGLADEDGPLGVAEDFVYLLRSATGVLDLMLAAEEISLGAAVLTYRDEALLVVQDLAEAAGMIRMTALTLDESVDELLRLIPALEAPMTAPFSLPRRAVQDAFDAIVARMPEPGDEAGHPDPMSSQEIDELLRSHGIDDRVARRMVAQLQPVLGNGQAGVARRDDTEDQWHRVGDELRWLDTERGRFRLVDDGEWMSVNPLTHEEIRAGLRRLAAGIR